MSSRPLSAVLAAALAAAPAFAGGAWLTVEDERHPVRDITVDQGHLYVLREDGTVLWLRRDSRRGEDWEVLDEDPANRDIEAAEGVLYMLKGDGTVWRLEPGVYRTAHLPPQPAWVPRLDRWSRVAGAENVLAMAAQGQLLYTIKHDTQAMVHTRSASWPVTWNLPVVKIHPGNDALWILTEDGEVWRYLSRHPVRLERIYSGGHLDGGKAVDVVGGSKHCFVLTEEGQILARERYPGLSKEERQFRVIATGARGAKLDSWGDRVLYMFHPGMGEIWRYQDERWYLELEDPRPRHILAAGDILYSVARDGTIWYRHPRRFAELPHQFGTVHFPQGLRHSVVHHGQRLVRRPDHSEARHLTPRD